MAVLATAIMFISFTACSNRNKNLVETETPPDSLPTLRTVGVNSLISDSGVVRYRIIADEWCIYERNRYAKWTFEQGIYMEKFDSLQHIDASIKADNAYYLEREHLWELRNNVHIETQLGDKFDTQQLFWNERTQKVYSEKFIRIEQTDKIITGYGFESNQQMTDYQIKNSAGIFDVEERNDTDSLKTEKADSVKTPPRPMRSK